MRKLLWVGDAVMKTGFAKVTHSVIDQLIGDRVETFCSVENTGGWDVGVLGINYHGDPHGYPYRIYPAGIGGDMWGMDRIAGIVAKGGFEAILVNSDPWVVADYLARLRMAQIDVPVVAYMPVDMPGCVQRNVALALGALDVAVFYTRFGESTAREAGLPMSVPTMVVPHGVDLGPFSPTDKMEARKRSGLLELVGDGFLIGNINQNQPRKRLDVTIRAFAEWRKLNPKADGWLYLHCDPERHGWNIPEVVRNYGVTGSVLHPKVTGIPDEDLRDFYASFDVQVTTTFGEGWGLTQMEGLACGIPQIAPRWSALGEWMTAGAVLVDCDDHHVLSGWHGNHAVNGFGGCVSVPKLVAAIDGAYHRSKLSRDQMAKAGRDLVSRPEHRWSSVAEKLNDALDLALGKAIAA